MIAPGLLDRVERLVGERPTSARGLRDDDTPWLLDFSSTRRLVLRVGTLERRELLEVERIGLHVAAAHGVAAPALVGADLVHDPPMMLVEVADGSSTIPRERPTARLRTLGAAAARLHRIDVPVDAGLPTRDRPISAVDFAALRAAHEPQPLMVRGERVVRSRRPESPVGFVHGDLWQGNAMFEGDRLTALIDWDSCGRGPAGVDLGSLRCDAAVCFGLAAADDVLTGWQDESGAEAADVAYWDVVAALSTPPDLGWFVSAIGGQGRDDLTREVLRERRDAYLAGALDSCDG